MRNALVGVLVVLLITAAVWATVNHRQKSDLTGSLQQSRERSQAQEKRLAALQDQIRMQEASSNAMRAELERHQQSGSVLKQQLEETRAAEHRLEAQLAQVRETATAAETTAQELQNRLQSEAERHRHAIDDLEARLAVQQDRLTTNRNRLQALQTGYQALADTYAAYRQQTEAQQRDDNQQLSRLEQTLTARNAELDRVGRQLQQVEDEYRRLQLAHAELDAAAAEDRQASADRLTRLQTALDRCRLEAEGSRTALNALKGRFEALAAAHGELEAAAAKLQADYNALEDLAGKRQEAAMALLAHLEQRVVQRDARLVEAHRRLDTCEAESRRLENKQVQLLSMVAMERRQAGEHADGLETCRTSLTGTQARLRTAEARIDALADEMAHAVEAAAARRSADAAALTACRTGSEDARAQMRTAEARIDALADELAHAVEAAAARRSADAADLTACRTSLTETRDRLHTAETHIHRLEDELAQARQAYGELSRTHEDLLAEMAGREEDLTQLRAELADRRRALEHLNTRLRAAHSDAHTLETRLKQEEARYEQLAREHESLLADAVARQEAADLLRARVAARQADLLAAQAALAAAQERIRSLEGQLARQAEAHRQLLAAHQQLRTQAASAAGRQEALERSVEQRDRLIARARTEMNEAQARIQTLDARLEARQQALVQLEGEHRRLLALRALELQEHNRTADRLERAGQQIQELTEELDIARQHIALVESELGKNKGALEGLQGRIQQLYAQKQNAEETARNLRRTYTALVAGLTDSIRSREATLAEYRKQLTLSLVNRVLFDFGSAAITSQGRKILKQVGDILEAQHRGTIRVVGHTDPVPIGPELQSVYPTNWELSGARAAAVVRFFQRENGIAPQRLEMVGHSFYQPVASNDTPEGRAQNRRVDIVLGPELTFGSPAP